MQYSCVPVIFTAPRLPNTDIYITVIVTGIRPGEALITMFDRCCT